MAEPDAKPLKKLATAIIRKATGQEAPPVAAPPGDHSPTAEALNELAELEQRKPRAVRVPSKRPKPARTKIAVGRVKRG